MTHQLRCRLLEHQGRSKFLSAERATAWPNPYKASLFQETNCSSARIVLSCCRGIGPGAVDRGSCADMLAVSRCQPSLAAPHPSGGAGVIVGTTAEHRCSAPLRPRKHAVPSDGPLHQASCGQGPRQCVSGSGEGQPTHAWCACRRLCRRLLGSQRGGPLNPDGAGRPGRGAPLGVPRRRQTGR